MDHVSFKSKLIWCRIGLESWHARLRLIDCLTSIDLSRIPRNNDTESRSGWTKYSKHENVHPNLTLVLLFKRTEVECAKGLLWKLENSWDSDTIWFKSRYLIHGCHYEWVRKSHVSVFHLNFQVYNVHVSHSFRFSNKCLWVSILMSPGLCH